MTPEYFRALFDYSYWARDRVLAAASRLAPGEYERAIPFTYGSIRGILVHCLSAEWIWRSRWQGASPTSQLREADLPTLTALVGRWREEERLMRAFLSGLTSDRVAGDLNYSSTAGIPFSNKLWELMAHVVNHSTSHRSEAAEALTMAGESPGDLDFLEYLRTR